MDLKSRIAVAAATLLCSSLLAAARPALQPFPRECAWGEDVVDAAGLPVIRDDVRQCEIGASELPLAGGSRVYSGEALSNCIYLAVRGSALADRLTEAFALDVPSKRQGYALAVGNGRIAVVGHDAIGALYGAETLRQLMADGGRTPAVRIRDWPDFAWRGAFEMWGGIHRWKTASRSGDKNALDVPALKAGFDEMLRHKLNTFRGLHSAYNYPTDPKLLADYREVIAYARERGIRLKMTIRGCAYTNLNNPLHLKGRQDWDCVHFATSYFEGWYCWSRDEENERMALWWTKYFKDIGAEDAIIMIHPRDTFGGGRDPEEFSTRCARCRERFGDDERWKATAHVLNIWNRFLKRELPGCSVGSCVQPYQLARVIEPAGADEETLRAWKHNTIDYWRQLSPALDDTKFWLCGWPCSKRCIAEYRKLVPDRPYLFLACYTSNPGVFMTSSRRLGTVFEGGDDESFNDTDTIRQGQWESMFLAGEYMWNTKAPGWEEFDGRVWYDPLADHTGPEVVMTTHLPAICRTFWGERIAPAMVDFLSSGILPKYLAGPGNTIGEWNRIRANAMYDPAGGTMGDSSAVPPLPPIKENTELVNGQVAAAEKALAALERARPFMDEMQENKRVYFGFYLRRAPYWLATARVRAAVFAAREAMEKGAPDGGLSFIAAARPVAGQDFAVADANAKALDRMKLRDMPKFMPYGMTIDEARRAFDKAERLSVAGTRLDDAGRTARRKRIVAQAGVQPDRTVDFPVAPDGNSEIWEGEHVVDRPVVLDDHKALYLKPGAKVVFRGEGRIEVKYAGFYAANAEFKAEDAMEGHFRIYVKRGDIWLDNCRFTNLKCRKPSNWGTGFIRMDSYPRRRRPMTVRHCTFMNCSSVSCFGTGESEIAGCLFDGCETAVCALMARNTFIGGNVMRNLKVEGLELRMSDCTDVFGNVFENIPHGSLFSLSRDGRLVGNFYSECKPYRVVREGKSKVLVEPHSANE